MYDQSYNLATLAAMLRKGDFRKIPIALRDAFRKTVVADAKKSATSIFNGGNPISAFHLKKKPAYRIGKLADELVVRKLSSNLRRLSGGHSRGRSFLVSTLALFLEEGVPYRIYRLDVSSFYESFAIDDIKQKSLALKWLSPLSKKHITALMDYYASIGGQGLPRGMAISAVLSDGLMLRFDKELLIHPAVYFYGRYVDDIVIITNLRENSADFLIEIEKLLPIGLQLNTKKTAVQALMEKPESQKLPATLPKHKFSFDYLGYQFAIYDPLFTSNKEVTGFRLVRIEIAPGKIKKIKQRIVRAFVEYERTKDASMLIERMRYLTSNFSVVDRNTGKKKLSGIFHSYPLLSKDSESLADLDRFLRNAVLSNKGRLFSKTSIILSSETKRNILSLSFTIGHSARRFVYFSPLTINKIQECWRNE